MHRHVFPQTLVAQKRSIPSRGVLIHFQGPPAGTVNSKYDIEEPPFVEREQLYKNDTSSIENCMRRDEAHVYRLRDISYCTSRMRLTKDEYAPHQKPSYKSQEPTQKKGLSYTYSTRIRWRSTSAFAPRSTVSPLP